ncbi:MAG TPA: GNAT family N-acetyltransferase, partial [Pseudolysinimonas sp.]
MTGFQIERLPVPETLDGPGGADFVAGVEARNASEVLGYGIPDVAYPAAELLPFWHDPHEPKALWGARVDGVIVARAVHEWQLDDASVGWFDLMVHPDFRGRGIGRALADELERHARSLGQTKLITYAVSPDGPGERLVPPTGAGSLTA